MKFSTTILALAAYTTSALATDFWVGDREVYASGGAIDQSFAYLSSSAPGCNSNLQIGTNSDPGLGGKFTVSLCGTNVDFYKRSSGNWDFYKAGGSGALYGTCYGGQNQGVKQCGGYYVQGLGACQYSPNAPGHFC